MREYPNRDLQFARKFSSPVCLKHSEQGCTNASLAVNSGQNEYAVALGFNEEYSTAFCNGAQEKLPKIPGELCHSSCVDFASIPC
jgi:hypothetical protein